MTVLRARWVLLLATAVAGAALFDVLAHHGARAATSYVAGVALAVLLFEGSAATIRTTERYLPNLTLGAAMFSYVASAVLLAVLLATSSPRVIDGPGIAIGLVVGVVVWVSTEVARTRVRSDRA